jgi:hypothetical protein
MMAAANPQMIADNLRAGVTIVDVFRQLEAPSLCSSGTVSVVSVVSASLGILAFK